MVAGLYDCWPISGLNGYYNTRMGVPCYLDITVTPEAGASQTSGTINFSMLAEIGLSTNATLHAIINETGIPGTGTYAGKEFDYSLRWNMAGANGTALSFGSSSETIDVDLDYTIDSSWDWEELYLTTFVQNNSTKEVLNSHMVKMSDLVSTGISGEYSAVVCTPGFSVVSPSSGAITFNSTSITGSAEISLFSLDGRLVDTMNIQNGIGVFSPENSGVYVLRLQTSEGFVSSKTAVFIR